MKPKYFKEYNIELYGKDSPGPGKYSPHVTFFKLDRHDAKTFTTVSLEVSLLVLFQEKRECPLIPKEQILKGDLGPQTYNL